MPIAERDYMMDGWQPRRRRPRIRWLTVFIITVAVTLLLFRIWSTSRNSPLPFQSKRHLVDVNSATVHELEELPYISAKVARAIVQGRPYSDPEDLLRVRGIGPKLLEHIRPHITLAKHANPQTEPRPD
jgi:competence ComEA-like helix-hairpin-helix protein